MLPHRLNIACKLYLIETIVDMRLFITLLMALIAISNAFGQTADSSKTVNQFRFNFINPAIEVERAIGYKSTISTGIGVGYGGGYPDLTSGGSGFISIISPFLDVQYKRFLNFEKRAAKGKSTMNNSANFVSLRFLTRGESISENVTRTSSYDFAIGPTWGLQRSLGEKFHLLFDIGPVYYFDTQGNGNIFPLIIQLNFGYNFK